MIDAIARLDPFLQAVLAGIFTWAVTALGAAIVLVRRDFPAGALDAMLGFAAGVMIAASVWSLLIPAIELAEATGAPAWLPASVGLLFGAGFLRIVDEFLPHLHLFQPTERAEGLTTTWRRTTLLVLAITLHNVPEGLAMGVAFGAAAENLSSSTVAGATALAVSRLRPAIGRQSDTGVLRDHRGLGLGRWLKAENLRRALAHQPAMEVVETFNAGSNPHMLAINVDMGFRPVRTFETWQADLGDVLAALGGQPAASSR